MADSQSSTLDPSTFLQLQEEERQRLAHALMEGPGQVLANALMEIEYSLPLLEKNPQTAIAGLTALRNELKDGLAQLRDYVAELLPPLLDEMGLGPSILAYVQKYSAHTGIRADCRGCELFNARYPATVEIALFRILQEALANVQTHAMATSVRIELSRGQNHVRMVVQDNGRGFAPQAQAMPNKRQLGLIAMRDRAELLGGQLQLFSETGRGVRVVITIPYHGHAIDSIPEGGQDKDERTNSHARPRRANNHNDAGQEVKPGSNHRKKISRSQDHTT